MINRSFAPAVLLALLVALVGCASPSEPSSPSTTAELPSTPDVYMVPLEDLAQMSDEQITQLATISVEAVTVNGQIDWNLYAMKLNDILVLAQAAGTSPMEMEKAYTDEVEPQNYVAKFDAPFFAGFGIPGMDGDWIRERHAGVAVASYVGHLKGSQPVIAVSELLSSSVIRSNESGATLEVVVHSYNNYFSSGAFNPESDKDVAQLGTNVDQDVIKTGRWTVVIQDGNILLSG